MTLEHPTDSANIPISIGDRVRFRDQTYTIKEIKLAPEKTRTREILGPISIIIFEEPQHTEEVATEISIDVVPF